MPIDPRTLELRGMAPLLQVFDMPTSVRFYRDRLGFEVIGSNARPPDDADWVWLRRDGIEIMLNTAYERPDRPSAPDPARIESHRDTCLYFSCPDVESAYRFLLAQGLHPAPPAVQTYGMTQCYLPDPDGYLLCFQWPATKGSRS